MQTAQIDEKACGEGEREAPYPAGPAGEADPPPWAAPLGGGILALLLAGVVLLVLLLSGAFAEEVTEADWTGCQQALVPAVLFDPAPFANIAEAEPDFLLAAGIWAALPTEEEAGADGGGDMEVSGGEVLAACAALFGPDCQPTLQTVTQQDVTFTYDVVTDTYSVPSTGQIGLCAPRIEGLEKKQGRLYAEVAYLSLDDFAAEGEEQQPVKTMEYVLCEEDGQYRIVSVAE